MVINYESYEDEYRELFKQATDDLNNFKAVYIDNNDIAFWPDTPYKKVVNGELKEITTHNDGKITEDFKPIYEAVKKYYDNEPDKEINSLEDYFSVLQLLTLQFDTNYQILPLEEPTFDIDLNTRSIKLPSGNYTYAVVGDEMAETIYFKSDRYFDNVDLNDMDIAVLVKTNNGQVYLIPTTVKDITTNSDKIIFGWPISNEITKNAETLEFSVRFFKETDNQLTYNLSTTTNKIQVKTGLTNDLDDLQKIELGTRAKDLLKNYPSYGTARVPEPTIVYQSWSDGDFLEDSTSDSISQTLYVFAESTQDKLEYEWKKEEVGKASPSVVEEEGADSSEYTEITEISEDDFTKYLGILYKKDGDTYIKLSKGDTFDEKATYYLGKNSSCTISSPGRYYCVAKASNALYSNTKSTSKYTVYGPAEPTFYDDLPNSFMLTDGQTLDGTLLNSQVTIEEDKTLTPYFLNSKYYTTNADDKLGLKVGKISVVADNLPKSGEKFVSQNIKVKLKNFLNATENESEETEITVYPILSDDYDKVEVKTSEDNFTNPVSKGEYQFTIPSNNAKSFKDFIRITSPTEDGNEYSYTLKYTDQSQGTMSATLDGKPVFTTYTLEITKKPNCKDVYGQIIKEKTISTGYKFTFFKEE